MNGDVDFLENILFIDTTSVNEYETLVKSANERTLAIPYNPTTTTRLEMETILLNNKCSRIGFVFSTYGEDINVFVENSLYDDEVNVEWLTGLICKYEISALDFFGCKTLLYDSWKRYYGKLTEKSDVAIYANPNVTGNSEYGGEWRLSKFCGFDNFKSEKNNCGFVVDVKRIYYNLNVNNYKYLFDGIHSIIILIDVNGYVWTSGDNNSSGTTYGSLGQGVYGNVITSIPYLKKINTSTTPGLEVNYNANTLAVGAGKNVSFISLKNQTTNRLYYSGRNTAGYYQGYSNTVTSAISFTQSEIYNASSTENVVKMTGVSYPYSLLLTVGGNVYASGSSPVVLGNSSIVGGTATLRKIPRANMFNVNVTDIHVGLLDPSGSSALCLLADGSLCGFGYNALLGKGTGLLQDSTTIPAVITNITGSTKPYKKISVSNTHSLVLDNNNKIYCAGNNTNGQFGNNTASLWAQWYQMTLPIKLPSTGAPTPSAIVAGNNVSYVLYSDGSLYGCGDNTKNQINSTATSQYTTLQYISPPFRKTIKQVTCMVNSTQILTTDNIPYSVGNDTSFGIGIGSTLSATTFTQMASDATGTGIVDVSSIGGFSTPITVSAKTPATPTLSVTPNALNSLTVTFNATTLGVSDPSLNYYYILDEDTTNYTNAGYFTLSTSSFTIPAVSSTSHNIALVAKIVDSNSNVLWSSAISTVSSTVNPYYADSAVQNLTLTPTLNTTTSIDVQFDSPATIGNPGRTTYQYVVAATGGTFVVAPTLTLVSGTTYKFTITSGIISGTLQTVRVR